VSAPDPAEPVAIWHAFAPDQLAEVITGVTRTDEHTVRMVMAAVRRDGSHTFSLQRRDLAGQFIGGARWRAERAGVTDWQLHLLIAEPEGVA
jgi:hypothetical protein